MEMSVREARAQFAAALAAVERGERVTITKNGKPVAELVAPPVKKGFDWERADRVRKELGLDTLPTPVLDEAWREQFDDPAWGRELFGLDDDWDPTRR
ncbi:type II toxin-antitoxin system prevent-host-death family antitoxin [Sphingomonas sp. ZT3P38]|uniref:type II toxin-antitoxin system Phd/YefM family antitoxin n=1 Tax=Parasphingomonas zepuensis TaxID=3096161 RepID=UPI002FC75C46